jgi:hypothetical protein
MHLRRVVPLVKGLDTDIFGAMSDIAPRRDCALVAVWRRGPTLGTGHLDPERAAEALAWTRPCIGVQIHWGTYRPVLGRGAPMRSAGASQIPVAKAAVALVPGVTVRTIAPGQPLVSGGPARADTAPLR